MKRPGLYLSILFICIVCSTALVATTVSSICKSFYKEKTEESISVKAPAGNSDFRQASVKL